MSALAFPMRQRKAIAEIFLGNQNAINYGAEINLQLPHLKKLNEFALGSMKPHRDVRCLFREFHEKFTH